MIITLKELNKFMPNIKLDLSIEKVINNLGYEVESITPLSDVKGVKFAKVINVYPNPNSKNLTVVELELANDEKITIQTNAKNAKVGAYTTAFVVGSQKGEIVFGAKKMAGIESQGMLCNFSELGYDISKLPFNQEDLMMLNQKLPLDKDPVEYFDLDDYIIDITTPANRPDANSYYVLAQEIAAYLNTKFDWFNWKNKSIKPKFKSTISVSRKNCNSLSFLDVHAKNKKSSLKDMLFLAKHGVEAKNIWAIDVTNLALIYTGAPTHAYDKDKIGSKLGCEIFTGEVCLLGDKTQQVNNVLAITNKKGAISLASVMGLENTKVDEKTENVTFEIGSFDSKIVRHGAKEIKFDTASSIQAGRGVNSQMVRFGMQYLQYKAHLDKVQFSNIVGMPSEKIGNSVLQNRHKLALYANCDIRELSRFDEVEQKLKTIGFRMDKNRLIAPNYRKDINNYEDIIEEYFRFYGYTNFEPIAPTLLPFKVDRRDISKNLLQSMGYNEIRTFTLESEQTNFLNPFNFPNTIKLQTFVSKEREQIRNSIISSMIQAADYNLKRKIDKFSFFEFGMINNNKYTIGLISNIKDFFEIKQDIINYLKNNEIEFIPFKDNEYIHPNTSAKIMLGGQMIGWIGQIHPKYSQHNLWVAEFMDIKNQIDITFESYNQSPLKTIDITFELDIKANISSKIDEIKNNFNIFSIYQIDSYSIENVKKITIRICADSTTIEKINEQYN
ncbi:Phenylalanine--tRNA ligase beta subunit [Mycoplasmopsis bovigenitalium]|uniref:Phenylalanine--tRNA ligase beta subunit n=1 Tax=Mycoplasmopsis bovigenitalium TaxID=2112 RepID=A0A449A8V6_9BACT|nr:phenylalanine--tRNA ligase subunit beta [Mycoplasmopsis bovigenitalium]VEU60705.1 Phenylalanine--tRNA ligase beta subunit [Mycoplasmopsis bovigenitalium]